jgi:DNA/RNA-binding domain of Phe-tRNA-synthetase-like protein
MKIKIDQLLQEKLPEFSVIGYLMDVENNKTDEVFNLLNNLEVDLKIEEVTNDSLIKETRDGYKRLGKDPSHTRPACEALIRRVIKGIKLYSLGDLIDLGNILSVKTKRSVCVVDANKIVGDVVIRIGCDGEYVDAINRGQINAFNLPVYVDEIGIFGSPTSDTIRTSVTIDTKQILVMVICFGFSNKEENENLLLDLYQTYANAKNLIKL